jgi:ATP-dependent protease ClpP protease subunit
MTCQGKPDIPLAAFHEPAIQLSGKIEDASYDDFREQLEAAPKEGLVVVSVATQGGNPEIARMIGEDVRMASEVYPDRRLVFCGKVFVYSAGVTLMSFFARENRFLRRGTRLMIHERQEHSSLALEGPLTSVIEVLKAKLNEFETAIRIQNEGFGNLVKDSSVQASEVIERAKTNWYIEAEEALNLGLVAAVL